jgi:hypothetical protein
VGSSWELREAAPGRVRWDQKLRRYAVRRSLSLAVVAIAIALIPTGQASAGGSWLYPDRDVYEPGDVARVHGSFGAGSLEGTLGDGPYVANLLPQNAWIEQTRVPEAAIRLGELRIVRDESYGWRASVTFTVPEVPTGWYHVGYCNDPCTVNGIGDLIGSQGFVIAPTRREGQYIVELHRLEARVDSVRQQVVARTRAERKRLERALEARTAELADAQARVGELEANLARLRTRESDRPIVPDWAIGLLAVAIIAAVFVARRARRTRVAVQEMTIPDTVPDELAQEESTRR